MKPEKIRLLLKSYYTGDISPKDYEILLSAIKEAKNLPPELEAERRMLLAVESYEPTIPDGFEDMLSEAIDKRHRKSNNIMRMLLSGAAAAVVLICVTIGMLNSDNKDLPDSEYIAESSTIGRKDNLGDKPLKGGTPADFKTTSNTERTMIEAKTASSIIKEEVVITIDDDELDKAEQIVDEALLNVLSTIYMAQNEVIESLDNIQILPTNNPNI